MLKNTLKALTFSLLIASSGAFAMKKADFIKNLNEQIAALQAERAELISTNACATEYIILAIDERIAALESEKERVSL